MIRATLVVLGVLVLFMIRGGIPDVSGETAGLFQSPIFIGLLAALSGLLVACCARRRRGLRGLVFVVAHMGVMLILVGAGLGHLYESRGEVVLPVGGAHVVDALPASETRDRPLPLGFRLSVDAFDVDYYDPSYQLFEPTVTYPRSGEDYAMTAELVLDRTGGADVPGYGPVSREELWDVVAGDWGEQLALTNGWILQRGPQTPKVFDATVSVVTPGERQTHALRVNKPVSAHGWRVYLLSYQTEPQPYVVCLLRRDPGRLFVVAGIWLTILGIGAICWSGGARSRAVAGGGA